MNLQDYSPKPVIEGVKILPLKVHKDAGGEFAELFRCKPANYSGEGAIYWPDESESPDFIVGEFDKGSGLQVNYSLLHPGCVKGFHLHKNQVDLAVPLQKLVVNLIDFRGFEEFEKKFEAERYRHQDHRTAAEAWGQTAPKMSFVLDKEMLIVPPGVLHGYGNPYGEDRILLYFVNQFFNPQDEFRLPYDIIGKEIWEIPKE